MTDEIDDFPLRHSWRSQHLRGRSFIQLAGGALRSVREPTQKIAITGGDDAVTQWHARAVIDLCLRLGEAMLATGASAADTVATVLRISNRYGLSGTHIDVTFTSISISVHRGLDEDPITVLRVIKVRTIDYTRLQGVFRLMEEIVGTDEAMDVDDARTRLSEVLSQPHPYRRWMVTLGKAVLAGGVVVMYDVSFVLVIVAALAAVAVDLITRRLAKWGVAAFYAQIAAAGVTTGIAVFMYWLRSTGLDIPGANRPTLVVISGIIMLLSGVGLTTAARDAIDGYYVTASARGMEVVMLTLGLAIGISVTLGLAMRLGIPMRVGTTLGPDGGLFFGMAGAGLIGVGFALTSYVELRVAPLMAVAAAVVYAVNYALLPVTDQPGVVPGIAGVAAGVIGYLTYRWLKVPEAAMTMVGVIGLIPGLAVYRALYAFMDSEYGVNAALPALVAAVATGLGLAAGTTIGGFLARQRFGLDRAAVAASRRTRGIR